MNLKKRRMVLATLFATCSLSAFAQQWTFQSGKQTNNGSVTVKSTSGSTQTATQNPTGAAAKVNQTAVTQAPLVVTQATATLPIVVEGTACNSATQQLGVKADLSIGYGCQANVWVRLNYIPTVVEGAGCGGYDKFGMTAGNAKQMACQGGVWKNSSGGTGLKGVYAPMAGKTISCTWSGLVYEGSPAFAYSRSVSAWARVDADGTPWVNVTGHNWSSGWVQGISATTPWSPNSGSASASITTNGLTAVGVMTDAGETRSCGATWPLN